MVDLPARQTLTKAVTRKKRRYKRKPYKPIDRDQFRDLRLINRLTIDQTAKLLQVTGRTVTLWECGASRIPYSAFKLLRVLANGELLPEPWKGWKVHGDTLYSPSGRPFRAYELAYLSNYLTMARYWLDECKSKHVRRQVLDLRPHLRLVTASTLHTQENAK